MRSGLATPVHELMSKPVVTAEPDEALAEAAARMEARHVGSVVVVSGGRPVGILTERDLVRATGRGGEGTVADWMTPDPVTVRPDASWTQASALLRDGGFRHLPVVDPDGLLVGIVSLRDLMRVAYLVMEGAVPEGDIEAPPGLAGVAVARTELSDVDGKAGWYHYHGYDAVELTERTTVEDIWFLLYEGHLPSADEREAFLVETSEARRLPEGVTELLAGIAASAPAGSLAALRTAVSATGSALGCRSWLDQDPTETRAQALRLTALVPVLAASLYRLATGREIVEPPEGLGYAADYLARLEGAEPDPDRVEALERYLLLTIEHGFNNSAFAARVIASSGADVAAAVTGAIGAFSGPLHGGAVGRVPTMLDRIGSVDRVDDFIRETLDRGERLMGFGHPVYETVDPRSRTLRELLQNRGGERVELASAFERTAVELLNERKAGRRREANVDFYAGVVLDVAGVPEELYDSTFAVARAIGWTAHVLEQTADNRIFRPAAHYVGPAYPRPMRNEVPAPPHVS